MKLGRLLKKTSRQFGIIYGVLSTGQSVDWLACKHSVKGERGRWSDGPVEGVLAGVYISRVASVAAPEARN